MIHREPYAELAKIYDRVMNHVKYDEWAEYIASIFHHFGMNGKHILEIACGTGTLSIFLHKLGYDVTSMDLSPAMLAVAAVKFEAHGMPRKLFAANMTSLPLKTEFDAVLCLYDSVNYLQETINFRETIKEVSLVIKNRGLFIFDICTVKNSRSFFSHNSIVENFGDVTYERKCCFHDTSCIQENIFTIECNGIRFAEKHLQRIYRPEG